MQRFNSTRSSGLGGATAPKFFSLARQLAVRRTNLRPISHKPPTAIPSLKTSALNEEIKRTLSPNYIPHGLNVKELRDMAKRDLQHRSGDKYGTMTTEEARKFLHDTESGGNIKGTQAVIRIDKELLKAEFEAVHEKGGHNPMRFGYRKDADHPDRSAKVMFHEQQRDAAGKAEVVAKPTLADQRRAHNALVNSMLSRGQQQPATPATPARSTGSMPSITMAEPVPLVTNSPTRASSMSPMSGGGHITQVASADETTIPSVTVGVPVAVSAEASHHVTPTIEPVTPLEPTSVVSEPFVPTVEPQIQAPEPSTSTPAASPVELPDMSQVSDPFGGED